MNLFEPGRICVKTMGREAGSFCVVVEKEDDRYVTITGPKRINGVRRRRCNTRHLEPIDQMLEISAGAKDDEILNALEEADLVEQFRMRIRIEE